MVQVYSPPSLRIRVTRATPGETRSDSAREWYRSTDSDGLGLGLGSARRGHRASDRPGTPRAWPGRAASRRDRDRDARPLDRPAVRPALPARRRRLDLQGARALRLAVAAAVTVTRRSPGQAGPSLSTEARPRRRPGRRATAWRCGSPAASGRAASESTGGLGLGPTAVTHGDSEGRRTCIRVRVEDSEERDRVVGSESVRRVCSSSYPGHRRVTRKL